MNRIEKIEEGCGVSFSIMYNGKIETFKLNLVSRYNAFAEKNIYCFLFVNRDRTLCCNSSCYSGGRTGFGKHTEEIEDLERFLSDNNCVILTSDIEEINIIATRENEATQKRKEEWEQKCTEKTKRINALPTEWETGIKELDAEGFKFVRTEATYNPTHSVQIQKRLDFCRNNRLLIFSGYTDEIGTPKKTIFNKDIKEMIGVEKFKTLPKNTLELLIERRKEINSIINNV